MEAEVACAVAAATSAQHGLLSAWEAPLLVQLLALLRGWMLPATLTFLLEQTALPALLGRTFGAVAALAEEAEQATQAADDPDWTPGGADSSYGASDEVEPVPRQSGNLEALFSSLLLQTGAQLERHEEQLGAALEVLLRLAREGVSADLAALASLPLLQAAHDKRGGAAPGAPTGAATAAPILLPASTDARSGPLELRELVGTWFGRCALPCDPAHPAAEEEDHNCLSIRYDSDDENAEVSDDYFRIRAVNSLRATVPPVELPVPGDAHVRGASLR